MDYREQPDEDKEAEIPDPDEIPLEEDDTDTFVDPEAEVIPDEDIVDIPKAKKGSSTKAHSPRRSVEDYLEKKRLRDEIGSVFEDEDLDLDKDLDAD